MWAVRREVWWGRRSGSAQCGRCVKCDVAQGGVTVAELVGMEDACGLRLEGSPRGQAGTIASRWWFCGSECTSS